MARWLPLILRLRLRLPLRRLLTLGEAAVIQREGLLADEAQRLKPMQGYALFPGVRLREQKAFEGLGFRV